MRFARRFAASVTLAAMLFTSLFAQASQTSPPVSTGQQQNSPPKCSDNATYVNSRGETVKRPRIVLPNRRELPPAAGTEPTVSVEAAEGHAHITRALPNGCSSSLHHGPFHSFHSTYNLSRVY